MEKKDNWTYATYAFPPVPMVNVTPGCQEILYPMYEHMKAAFEGKKKPIKEQCEEYAKKITENDNGSGEYQTQAFDATQLVNHGLVLLGFCLSQKYFAAPPPDDDEHNKKIAERLYSVFHYERRALSPECSEFMRKVDMCNNYVARNEQARFPNLGWSSLKSVTRTDNEVEVRKFTKDSLENFSFTIDKFIDCYQDIMNTSNPNTSASARKVIWPLLCPMLSLRPKFGDDCIENIFRLCESAINIFSELKFWPDWPTAAEGSLVKSRAEYFLEAIREAIKKQKDELQTQRVTGMYEQSVVSFLDNFLAFFNNNPNWANMFFPFPSNYSEQPTEQTVLDIACCEWDAERVKQLNEHWQERYKDFPCLAKVLGGYLYVKMGYKLKKKGEGKKKRKKDLGHEGMVQEPPEGLHEAPAHVGENILSEVWESVHRLVYFTFSGTAIDDKVNVAHLCHNKRCCTFAHLVGLPKNEKIKNQMFKELLAINNFSDPILKWYYQRGFEREEGLSDIRSQFRAKFSLNDSLVRQIKQRLV